MPMTILAAKPPTLELPLSVDGLKRSFAMLKEEGKRAEQAGWREAFGDQAELTDLEPEDERAGADADGDEGFGEFVTF